MSCLPCFGKRDKKESPSAADGGTDGGASFNKRANENTGHGDQSTTPQGSGNIQAQCFKFRELALATDHFTPDFLLGEGDFARVYKGTLDNGNQTAAIKQLDRNGVQDNKEFLVSVLMLSLLHHPNLVNLIGYCADGDQRLLVYEFMPNGTLEDHLLDLPPEKKPMSWYTRMKIAYGAAQGLEYLHDKANPPVIYRDFKSSKILLDDNLTPKLSDICVSKISSMGDRGMGTYGYCAPEGDTTGQLTLKSDVYSFGVVLLELITGRRAMDTTKPTDEQNLVAWAKPMFREQKRYPELVDPAIKDDFPSKGLNQIVAIAAMCLQEESSVRPLMADVVITLGFLADAPPEPSKPAPAPTPEPALQVDPPKSPDSSECVVETLQLGTRNSKPASRAASRSSSSSSESETDGECVSSKHSKRSTRSGSDATSSLKLSRKESEHVSDDESDEDSDDDGSLSSKHSSKHGSGIYLSLRQGVSFKQESRSSSSKQEESPHQSGGEESSGEESDGSASRHSHEDEHEYESD